MEKKVFEKQNPKKAKTFYYAILSKELNRHTYMQFLSYQGKNHN